MTINRYADTPYGKINTTKTNSANNFSDKIEYTEGTKTGILQKKGQATLKIIPGETAYVNRHEIQFGEDTPESTYVYNENGYKGILNLIDTETKDAGYYERIKDPRTFYKTHNNTITNYYDSSGKLYKTTYSWGGTDDHETYHIDEDGYEGYIHKVDTVLIDKDEVHNSDGSYRKISVWEGQYEGTIKYRVVWVEGINNIGYYSGEVSEDSTSAYEQEYEGVGVTQEYKEKNFAESYNQECVNEPVNIITGNYYSNETDLKIQGYGPSLEVSRYYNSLDERVSKIGKSWRLNYDTVLENMSSEDIKITYPDGHSVVFEPVSGTNKYTASEAEFDELYKNTNNTYDLKRNDKLTYKYNNGKLISITDLNNNSVTLQYNSSGYLYKVISASGKSLTFTNENGKIKNIVDSNNRKISYNYNGSGYLTSVIKPNGGVVRYDYNSKGITSITDENNVRFIENEYDEFGRIIKQKDDDNNITTYNYDELNMVNTYTCEETNRNVKYEYTDKLYIDKKIYDDGSYEEYGYDEWGNKNRIKDRNGNVTTFQYNERGNLLSTTSSAPFNYQTSFEYDQNDNITKMSTQDGQIKTFVYDNNGNLTKTIEKIDEENNAINEYSYNPKGQIITSKDAEGNISNFSYDNLGNLTKITDAEGNETEFEYDNLGRKISETTAYGTTNYTYNDLDKVEKIVDPNNNITRLKYDSRGNLIKQISPEQYNASEDDGIGVTYQYDGMDRLIKQVNSLGYTSAILYDQDGNKVKEVDANNYNSDLQNALGVKYEYDSSNRVIKIKNPSGEKSRIIYDAVGNIIETINANNYSETTDDGKGINYAYDSLNRIKEIKDDDGNVIKRYVYDTAGRIIKEIDAKGYQAGSSDSQRYGTVYKYNLMGWMIEKRTPVKKQGEQVYYNIGQYAYDKNGRMIQEKKSSEYVTLTDEPSNWFIIENTYDKNGKIKTISDSNGAYLQYSYDGLGNLIEEKTKINESTFETRGFEYDSLGRLVEKWYEADSSDLNIGGEGTTKIETKYEYDKNNNLLKTISPEGYITTYEYDSDNKLIKENKEVTVDDIDIEQNKIYVSSNREVIYPDQTYQYDVIIDANDEIVSSVIEIDYDSRIFELIEAESSIDNAEINTQTGKITINLENVDITSKTKILTLNMKTKDLIQGFGYIEIKPDSNYTDGSGNLQTYTELIGKNIYVQIPDMNGDKKIETNDFTLTALQKRTKVEDVGYNEKFDIDNSGLIDNADLDHVKDWIFLNKIEKLKKIEKRQENIAGKYKNLSYELDSRSDVRETIYRYDKVGNIVKVEDCNGNEINYSYDALNKLTSIENKEGGVTRIFYDEEGNTKKVVQPENYNSLTDNGKGKVYNYDYQNRLIEIIDEEGNIIEKNTYDLNGNLINYMEKSNYSSEYTYDIGNRVTSVITPQGRNIKYSYDASGNILNYIDGEGNSTSYERDIWGNITKVIDANNVETNYEYDYAGNLIKTVDGNNNTTEYVYNSLNMLKEIKDPNNGKITYKYDKEGRIAKQIDRKGQNIINRYNSDNNIVQKQIQGTDEIEKYLYNLDGTVLAAINNTQVDTFEYNKNGQIVKKYKNGEMTLNYGYNMNGNKKSISNNFEEKVGYEYDSIGRLNKVLYNDEQKAKYNYNADYTVCKIEYDSGITVDYSYSKDKDVQSIIARNSQGNIITQSNYQYNNNASVISQTIDGETTTYGYDKLDRLKDIYYPKNITEKYTYDNVGNRIQKNYRGQITAYTYDSNNKLQQSSINGQATVYNFDLNGNLIEEKIGSEATTYKYDGFNRLTEVTLPDESFQINKYNALGLRTETIENAKTTGYIYDGINVIMETDSAGQKVATNIRGLELISQINNENKQKYYLSNAHGDILDVINRQGDILNNYKYDPFGNITEQMETLPNRYKYAGEQYDEVTGKYYLRARHYDPQVGRFIQEDTYRGDGLNLYTYVANNPLKYVDPSGYSKCANNSSSSRYDKYSNLIAYSGNVGDFRAMEAGRYTLSLEKYKYIKDPAGQVYCAWNDTIPSNRIDILKLKNSGFFGMEFYTRLSYLESKGIDVTKLEVQELDQIYEVEHFTKVGMIAGGVDAAATISLNIAKAGTTVAKGMINLNPNAIRFSQSSVNGSQEIIKSMKKKGWTGEPIDVVRMSDGGLTTIDNTRVVAARAAGIDVKAVVHNANDVLPQNLIKRFTTKKGVPTTWEEAIELRIGKQKSSFKKNNPFGSYEMERVK
ncbi:RHS repeat-associated core domain-containing protein [Anaerovorax odorimutans]|uniref:RHS repeat-associated core domain-containing protein n=1 Tax=Anaerovorax odorimutans TaxID=109327 RepID=UPI0004172C87|nr:RHS repeat-associated core domain-containing protein [Anaerovorax odorimutans]